jgi:hypothetical protein
MIKLRSSIIKCSECKKKICVITNEYTMNIDVVCINCHTGKKPKKRKRTMTENYTRMKKGVRVDVHPTYSFRSATEANFARILNYLNLEWKFEERVFTFDHGGYKTKPYMYIMDFEIISGNKEFPAGFYEIKGYMTPDARKKLRRLKKLYPEEYKDTTVVVYTKYKKKDIAFCKKLGYEIMFYDEITKKYSKLIKGWE